MTIENKAGENLNDDKNQLDFENLTDEQKAQIEEDEKFILEFSDEDYADAEKIEKLQELTKNLKTTIQQKNHFRDKYKSLKDGGSGKAPEKKPEAKPTESTPPAENKNKFDKADILEFRTDNGLTKEVAEKVAKYASANDMTLDEALKDEVMQSYIKTKKDDKDIDDAIASPSGRGSRKPGEKDWSTASNDEIIKMRTKIMQKGAGY